MLETIYMTDPSEQMVRCGDCGLPFLPRYAADHVHEAEELGDIEEWQRDAARAFVAAGYELGDFQEAYSGEWATFREFAEMLADDMGALDERTNPYAGYFDLDAWARDLGHDYFTEASTNGGVWVFRAI